ncbi:MAG: uracil-DNA glycosylase [Candidatus Margulisiibacteriota bacterium]
MIDLFSKTPYDEHSYDQLKEICSSCQNCGLHSTRTNVVVGSGKVPSNLMIIGEGPGEQEDLQGVPFVGKAGQLLTKILESAGINRETDAYIANVVKCRPPGNRTPLTPEIEACKPYLIRQVQLVKPKVLILLGSPSLKTILEEPLPISKVRGNWYKAAVPYMEDPLYIMPMFHPSYLLRNQSREKGSPKWLTWQDILEVKAALDSYATPS